MKKSVSTTENLQILHEDNHLIIINKRSGDLVQGDKTGDTPLSDIVKGYIKKKYDKPGAVYLGVTHRLDRPTTGVVVFAKTSKALTRMNALFLNKKIAKTYWAIVKNKPKKQKQKPIQKTSDTLLRHADGFHKTPAEWQAKYPNMPNPPGTMGFATPGISGWIPKPKDRWYRIHSKEYNEYYYHNFCDKKSEWTEPKYWLDY